MIKSPLQIDTSGGSAPLSATPNDELDIKTYPSCSVYCLKYLISKQLQTAIQDLVLTFQGQTLENSMNLQHYQIVDSLP